MNGSDICIYAYLGVLGIGCLIYGIIVVWYGGLAEPPLRVNVALPLDISSSDPILANLSDIDNITNRVTVNVWWGRVETEPLQYDWSDYSHLFSIIQANLTNPKVRVVLNFHACTSENVFCGVNVSLPPWIYSVGNGQMDIFYQDANNFTSFEYLTSGVDHINMFPPSNRTAVEMYVDFVQSFAENFKELFDSFIYEVQIGLGPAGELRYPAFPPLPQWEMPGIGSFQCYDQFLQTEYMTYAQKLRQSFAYLPPADAAKYSDIPKLSNFFGKPKDNGSASDYGQFFMNWYSNRLLQHGGVILSQVSSVLRTFSPNVTLSTKVGCIYWQSADPSHAAEITAGYTNYTILTEMLQAYNVRMVFGCFDLEDRDVLETYKEARPGPQQLVSEMLQTAKDVGLQVIGTNSNGYDNTKFDLIVDNVKHDIKPMAGFTYNSLSSAMTSNLKDFRHFVDQMNATRSK